MTTDTLQHLIEDVASWPAEDVQELADYARAIQARRSGRYSVSESEREAIVEGIGQADRGEFVPASTLAAWDTRHGA
jgi:hypothetical protein